MTDLSEGHALKLEGMSIASDAQDKHKPGWSDRAYEAIVAIANSKEYVHVNDVLKIFTERPKHFNAWGGIWSRAIRNRVIRPTGMRRCCNDKRKHAHASPVYQSLIFKP